MKKLLFFVNPKAGNGAIVTDLMDVLLMFREGGYEITIHPTQGPGEIPKVLAEIGHRFDLVVSSGGDGTLNETVSGLMALENPPVMGYLPSGTINDMAYSLGLSMDPIEATQAILVGQPMDVDVGKFQDRWFSYVAAFGALTDVPYTTRQADKRIWGRMAYLFEGVKALTEIAPIHVRVTAGDWIIEDDVLVGLVASTTSVGGFRTGNQWGVHLNDGLFEVVLIKKIKNLLDFQGVATALLRREFQNDYFYTFQTNAVEFQFQTPTPWTLDGEFGGTVTYCTIENHHNAVRIMTPSGSEGISNR